MKRLLIEPHGWPCTLAECPPGFFLYQDDLCMKTEYVRESIDGKGPEAYCDSGEAFWGGVSTNAECAKLVVQPVNTKWEEYGE
jgi:hypothetical protein